MTGSLLGQEPGHTGLELRVASDEAAGAGMLTGHVRVAWLGRVCHERGRELEVGRVPERGAAWKMKDVGPSEPSCGGRLQTTFCCIS